MVFKQVLKQLNVFAQCKKYGLSLRQCPQFLFLIMGVAVGVTTVSSYLIGTRYIVDHLIVSLLTIILTTILLIITFVITKSMERLAEANRLKSEFVNIVSHQLRSPLTSLKWSADALVSPKLGKLNEKQLEYFKILTENMERMRELVADLLTISRIEEARLVFQKSEFSLVELVKEMIAKFQPRAKASDIEINLQVEDPLPKVVADSSQLKIVVENLLENAIRYTKNPGRIEIKIEQKEKNLLFKIKDTGVGIPEEDQKRIFEKFFRSVSVVKREIEGSGLGLYITKAIIERTGGKIWFKSKEGKGTTFYFTLPVK